MEWDEWNEWDEDAPEEKALYSWKETLEEEEKLPAPVAELLGAYGRYYVQFFIVDVDRLDEWRGVNWPDFRVALQRANAPHFNPGHDLRLDDVDGGMFDVAAKAAFERLNEALWAERVNNPFFWKR